MAHRTATTDLFGGVIARELAAALGPQLGKSGRATLTKYGSRERADDDPLGGTRATVAVFQARGFVSSYESTLVDGTLIQQNDRKVTLLGATIKGNGLKNVAPEVGDRVTIGGDTYAVVNVEADPALATYKLQGRR